MLVTKPHSHTKGSKSKINQNNCLLCMYVTQHKQWCFARARIHGKKNRAELRSVTWLLHEQITIETKTW